MYLKVIGSSSKGNAYILGRGSELLLLEAGVPALKIKQSVDFDISSINGCLVTHEHGDHSKYVNDILDMCIPVYLSAGTNKALRYKSKRLPYLCEHGKAFMVKNFKVMPFNVKHDCCEPLGYLIHHKDCGTTLFATDTYYLPNTFVGLTNIIIEVNYDEVILNDNVENGKLLPVVKNRVMESHMSLSTCKEFLLANDLSNVRNIVLIHLSDGNSHAQKFKKEIELLTGKQVHVASAGDTIFFNKGNF